ncbi:hypothetical protein [Metapseudomonas otitidis]|uniref:hypothetical protein n=1 Tax=Metapseudomonas otitidis TaxID=319939 RepID=UPI002448B802|nr:hypothetical protein [Pseudomonas otitidis]MDG9782080.1 hypothetical protein [Pseudomonas otitidis]
MVLRIEGRREALGICERAQAMLTTRQDLERLLEQLQTAASGRPESYAAGVLEVADLVEKLLPGSELQAWDETEGCAPQDARTTDRSAPRSLIERRAWP